VPIKLIIHVGQIFSWSGCIIISTLSDKEIDHTSDLPDSCLEDEPDELPHQSVSLAQLKEGSAPILPLPTTLALTPRRELVWRSRERGTSSLALISQQFQYFLQDTLRTSSHSPLQRRQGRSSNGTPHRCAGYNREEITLTPDVAKSSIVSHLTPIPHEICPMCGEVVNEADVFSCICGNPGESPQALFLLPLMSTPFNEMMELDPPSSAQVARRIII
jgi:hypothetical protein